MLEKNFFSTKYVTLIKNMYTNVVTSIRACDDESNASSIKIELHQGSTLSPYTFYISDMRSRMTYKEISLDAYYLLRMWC
jgi:hypothetical protein